MGDGGLDFKIETVEWIDLLCLLLCLSVDMKNETLILQPTRLFWLRHAPISHHRCLVPSTSDLDDQHLHMGLQQIFGRLEV